MSIYATWLGLDDEDHAPSCERMVPADRGAAGAEYVSAGPIPILFLTDVGTYRLLKGGTCTCGSLGAPIVYRGSHVLPAVNDPRAGSVDVGVIPDHIEREGKTGPHNFLRLGTSAPTGDVRGFEHDGFVHATVILDRRQIEALRDTLTMWLDAEEIG